MNIPIAMPVGAGVRAMTDVPAAGPAATVTAMKSELDLLRSVVCIPSPSGHEQALGEFLAGRMARLGLRTELDGAGNFHATAGTGDGPTIMLLGHLDTVPGTLPVRADGDILHGRGTVDAKGPLAAMLCAAVRLGDSFPGRLEVVGAVDEEGGSRGARYLRDGPAPDALIIGEPSGAGRIGIGYKGILRFRLEVDRPPAHTSSPERGAAEVVADLWPRVRALLTAADDDGAPAFERAAPSVVSVTGGLQAAELTVSCRVPPGFDAIGVQERLARLPGLSRLAVIESVPAVRSARTDPVVRAFGPAIRRCTGQAPRTTVKLGTSDWNVVNAAWPVPTAAYGPGDSRLCHTDQEQLSMTEYLTAVDVLTEALPRLARDLAALVPSGALT